MSLYKYSKYNYYTKENILENKIYFSTPLKFNDPYEFAFKFDVSDADLPKFEELIFGKDQLDKISLGKEELLHEVRQHYYVEAVSQIGVSCLSDKCTNDLMWAHYGDNHTGICLEYNDKLHPFNLFKKVNYVDSLPIIQGDELLKEQYDRIMEVLYTKNSIWSYENEYRFTFEADKSLPIELGSLLSITFGFHCKNAKKKQIIKDTKHLNIKYYQIVRAKNNYIITRVPFSLT